MRAAELGYRALALTDECSLAGVVRAHLAIRKAALPLRLIVGCELTLSDGPTLVMLACNRNGYGHLSRLISQARRTAPKGSYYISRNELDQGLPDCLALLIPSQGAGTANLLGEHAAWLKARFVDRCWLAVAHTRNADHARRLETLVTAGLPLVAAGGILMHVAARRPLADALGAIRLRTTISASGLALQANAERRLHSRGALARRYPPALLAATLEISARCRFSLDELRYEYPDELVPANQTPARWLRQLTEGGLIWRHSGADQYGSAPAPGPDARPPADIDPAPPEVRKQIEHELALIGELNYEAYFLTVHDIVRFARNNGILCQGRGSAANSAVCWALGITEVDPALGIMLVERFISAERNEPPDIDVDFEHERREEVIQYLYQRYGRERAALAATVITYRPRSALRDLGKALGIGLDRIERLTRDHFWWDGKSIPPERLLEAGLDPTSPTIMKLLGLVRTLIGFPRHLSQHVGGFVIARGRLDELVPVENAAMPDRTIIQWDKDDLDALGLLKVDVLALGMLSALRRCLDMVAGWRGRPFGLASIPKEVPGVYEMLSDADSIGVFQVESRAQMTMLPRLKPRCFYDLVVEVAIVRPGPIQGGMVHPYLEARARLEAEEAIEWPRPEIRAVLERTLGVPIFQEQVMQLAVAAAGFTPGEADQLRRSMGAWRRQGELEQYQQQLVRGMLDRGYSLEFAEQLCRQIQGFGSYGFPESHAASFALLVYFSAWLKRFEPAAFLCSLLNSQPMGFYSPSQLIQDARRHGVQIRGADVTRSNWDCQLETLEPDAVTSCASDPLSGFRLGERPAARLGLRMIKGLPEAAAQRISRSRLEDGVFHDVDELARRAGLDVHELRLLASAGALDALAGHRRQALWQAAALRPDTGVLQTAPVRESMLSLPAETETQSLTRDYAQLGFTLGRHPLALLRKRLCELRFLSARQILDCADRQLARTAGIVTCRQRPGTAKGTLFITLEDESGLANIIVRPELLDRQRRELLSARLLGVFGQVSRQGKVVHLIASRVVDHTALLGRLVTVSRDFH